MGLAMHARGAWKDGLSHFFPLAAPPEHRGLLISRNRALNEHKWYPSRAERGLSMSRKRALDETKRGAHIFSLGFARAAEHRDRRRRLLLSIVV